MATKAANTVKELIISIVGIIIAIVLAVFALGVANWAIDVFNITDNLARAAALIAVAIVIGPAIAAFATKKYY
jgi:ABC-type transport system involved in cytochrome c biogenesis permease component